jgi:glucoamylase
LNIRNQPPRAPTQYPAAAIVDAGFLELVRYGIRKAGDSLVEDTLHVIDAALKIDFPGGPCWYRYTHDGYGQQDDGSGFIYFGRGRPWPLLTGERGHYEFAAGRDIQPYIRAMESFATATRLLPEQLWDQADLPRALMYFGKPTGAAMPLMWAHAEYIKLLRTAAEGQVFDLIPEVANRYLRPRRRTPLEIWKFNRQVKRIPAGATLRIMAKTPFALHWGRGDWQAVTDTLGQATGLGLSFVDIATTRDDSRLIRFTFHWLDEDRWEGHDFAVELSG